MDKIPMEPRYCCCCRCRLLTGVLIFAAYEIIGSVISIGLCSWAINGANDFSYADWENMTFTENELQFWSEFESIMAITITSLFIYCYTFVAVILNIVGLVRKNRYFMLPYMIGLVPFCLFFTGLWITYAVRGAKVESGTMTKNYILIMLFLYLLTAVGMFLTLWDQLRAYSYLKKVDLFRTQNSIRKA